MTSRADMKSAAKFKVVCARCGKKSSQPVTDSTAYRWMSTHEAAHRQADLERGAEPDNAWEGEARSDVNKETTA